MGLEQWGASEQYYKIASVHPEYELGRVISQEKESNILFLILKNWQKNVVFIIAHIHLNQDVQYELQWKLE